MKWLKKGKIFDPSDVLLPNNCQLFSQSPQVLPFKDHNRVYFSTREVTPNNKYLSHISFVDFDKNFENKLKFAKDTVIPLGGLGTFDEHGIFPLNVLKDDDKILGFIGGWTRRSSVSVDTGIGLAISSDGGYSFQRMGPGPILTASIDEPFLVGDPFVLKIEEIYHMWYIFGLRWVYEGASIPERVYKIGHAVSTDLLNWKRTDRQIIYDVLNKNECQALPTVAYWQNRYHMIFCFREAVGFRDDPKKGYRLGYAWSEDLTKWHRADGELEFEGKKEGWDSDMQCYPHLYVQNDDVFLLYNGNEFGRSGFGIAKLVLR